MSQDDDVERVARAILRVRVQGFNLGWDESGGRSVIEYGREMARAALSAMPPRDELLREALNALEPFAAEYEYWVTDIPEQLMLSDGNGTLSPADIKWDAIVRARAAAEALRKALGEGQS